jgi:hypothetical protein
MTTKPVISIPYWDHTPRHAALDRIPEEPRFSHDRPLRLGFIGAHNSVNIVNIQTFLKKMVRYVHFYNAPVVIVIAGNVCRQIDDTYSFVTKLGRVADISDFYHAIDAVIAPLEFSTGIKIKVGEALAWQIPVLATQNAFDGFQAFHPTQSEPTVAAVCGSIVRLAFNEVSYKQLLLAARRSARAADKAQETGFTQLRDGIRESSYKILFITDRPFWHRSTYVDELVAQAIEYVSNVGPTIVISLCSEVPPATLNVNAISYVHIGSEDQFATWLADARGLFRIIGSIHYNSGNTFAACSQMIQASSIPTWHLDFGSAEPHQAASLVLTAEFRTKSIILSPLRYAPLKCQHSVRNPGVVVWSASRLSEWESLMYSLVSEISFQAGLTVTQGLIPEYAEFDTTFFAKSTLNASDRWIVLRQNNVAESFLLYTARYLDIRAFVLSETFTCPARHSLSMPSISNAIRNYINGESRSYYAGGSNTGWDTLWQELEERLMKPAASVELHAPVRRSA